MTDDAFPATQRLEDPSGRVTVRLPRLRIVVVDGPDRGREAAPDRPVVRVGTDPELDLVLTDPTVSRHHCELSIRRHGIRIRESGSSNGTWLDATRIYEVEVPSGTLVRVGQTTLRVTTAEDTVQIPLSGHNRFGALLGRSAKMREVFAILERVGPTDVTVLLEGESGTGKELAAEGVHAVSPRADGPFVVFDCGAVPRDLVESALFGHVRGAFTGAVADRAGVFEEADGGTLFLDEIGELPLDLQPKLLRALEKREIVRVGENERRTVDVRIVAATNRSLDAEVNAGRFREDLFYRIAVVKVTLPPLRSRSQDIPMLVEHFLKRLAPPAGPAPTLPAEVLEGLSGRPWRGNVRELKNVVERAVALAGSGGEVEAVDARASSPGDVDTTSLAQLPYHEARERLLVSFERSYFRAALEAAGGNVSAAARTTGVSRTLLHRLMKRHGLD